MAFPEQIHIKTTLNEKSHVLYGPNGFYYAFVYLIRDAKQEKNPRIKARKQRYLLAYIRHDMKNKVGFEWLVAPSGLVRGRRTRFDSEVDYAMVKYKRVEPETLPESAFEWYELVRKGRMIKDGRYVRKIMGLAGGAKLWDEYKMIRDKSAAITRKYKKLRSDWGYRNRTLSRDGEWKVYFIDRKRYPLSGIGVVEAVTVLPSKPIRRLKIVNNHLGPKRYPETKLVVSGLYPHSRWTQKVFELKHAIDVCRYGGNMFEDGDEDIAIAVNNGVVVGGFSYGIDGKTFKIDYLCSGKLVANTGTVLLYAAEEFARQNKCDRIRLRAAGNAKPFYFKTGLVYTKKAAREGATSIRVNNSNNNSNNSATSKRRRLVLPSGNTADMVRLVR